MIPQDPELPLSSHLEALRKLLIKSIFLVLSICLVFFFLSEHLIFTLSQLIEPETYGLMKERLISVRWTNASAYTQGFEAGGQAYSLPPGGSITLQEPAAPFLLLSPVEGFKSAFKLSFFSSLTLCFPVISIWIQRFIWPALSNKEKAAAFPVGALCVFLMLCGLLFGFFLTLPVSSEFFRQFNQGLGLDWWSLSQYIEFVLWICLASGLSFGGFALLFVGVHHDLISHESLRSSRRGVILAVLILAAVLTPPDVLTQIMVALPLLGLYELALIYGKWRQKIKD